jgi:plasmid stability protein
VGDTALAGEAAMHIRFDENDDLLADDIPDDLMAELEALAEKHGRTPEDEMRDLLMKLLSKWEAEGQ